MVRGAGDVCQLDARALYEHFAPMFSSRCFVRPFRGKDDVLLQRAYIQKARSIHENMSFKKTAFQAMLRMIADAHPDWFMSQDNLKEQFVETSDKRSREMFRFVAQAARRSPQPLWLTSLWNDTDPVEERGAVTTEGAETRVGEAVAETAAEDEKVTKRTVVNVVELANMQGRIAQAKPEVATTGGPHDLVSDAPITPSLKKKFLWSGA